VRHDDDLVVRVDLPGIKPEEVRIEVEDGILTVSGEHEERRSEEDDDGRYLRRERRLGAFSRSIALPSVWMRKRSRRRRATAWSR
jgi:HSP20 family protein